MAMARQLFQEGVAHARAEEWEPARASFERSYAIAAVPVTLLNLASAQAQVGQLVAGLESYRNFLSSAGDSRRAARYRTQAEQAVAELEPRIAHLTLRVEGLQAGDELTVGGSALSRAALGGDLPVDPGDIDVQVLRAGDTVASESVHLAEGEARVLTLIAHRAVPSPTRAAQASVGEQANEPGVAILPSEGEEADDSSVLSSPWLWTGVGVAVVGAVLAGVLVAGSGGASPYQGNIGSGGLRFR